MKTPSVSSTSAAGSAAGGLRRAAPALARLAPLALALVLALAAAAPPPAAAFGHHGKGGGKWGTWTHGSGDGGGGGGGWGGMKWGSWGHSSGAKIRRGYGESVDTSTGGGGRAQADRAPERERDSSHCRVAPFSGFS